MNINPNYLINPTDELTQERKVTLKCGICERMFAVPEEEAGNVSVHNINGTEMTICTDCENEADKRINDSQSVDNQLQTK